MWIRALLDAPPRLASLLYWDCAETERIVRNRDGALMACLRLRGVDLHSAMATELVLQADRLNNALKRFGAGWTVLAESRRQEVCAYPHATWPEPVSRLVDQERAALFTTTGQHYETVTTLTLTYKPRLDIVGGVKHLFWEHLPPDDTSATVERFADDITRTVGMLQDCCESVTWLAGADLLTYLHASISPKGHRVRVPEPAAYLNTYLCDTDLTREFVSTTLLRWPRLGEHWLRCITVRAYPRQSYPGMVDVLNTLPLAFRACVRWVPLDRATAIRTARKSRKEHYSMRGSRVDLQEQAALDFANESSDFQAGLQHNEYSAGYLTQTVVVWDTTFEGAKAKAEQVEEALNTQEFVAKIETVNTMAAWQGTLPGDSYSNWRRALMSSWNLAHVFPGTTQTRGPAWNAHLNGPPLLTTVGRGQTPFALDLHDDDTSHTMIIGPTGAGKSFLLALLCVQWLKYTSVSGRAQVYIFDKDQSARALTYGVGGQWFDLGHEISKTTASGVHLDDAETKPWGALWEPPLGWWQCFETASLLKTPDMIQKIILPLTRQLEQNLTGAPSILAFDEAWRYLNLDFFRGKIQDYLLTLRKANGTVIFSTQNLEHIAKSDIGMDIFDSCVTKVYMANPNAMTPEIGKLYRDIGLTERECHIIAGLVRKRQYYYTGAHGRCVFELGAGPVQLAFCGSGRKEDLAAMAQIYEAHPGDFARQWLRYKGLGALTWADTAQ